MYDAADTVVAQRLSQVDGVAEVSVNGAEQPAIRIRVNPIALASMGLSMEDVRNAVANANAAGPLGTFDGDDRAVTIATNDQLRAASQYDAAGGPRRQRHRGAAFRHRLDRAGRAQQPLVRLVQPPAVDPPGASPSRPTPT